MDGVSEMRTNIKNSSCKQESAFKPCRLLATGRKTFHHLCALISFFHDVIKKFIMIFVPSTHRTFFSPTFSCFLFIHYAADAASACSSYFFSSSIRTKLE